MLLSAELNPSTQGWAEAMQHPVVSIPTCEAGQAVQGPTAPIIAHGAKQRVHGAPRP